MDLVLLIILIVLIALSAFFSGSETGMMSINRYRLRHQARRNHRSAIKVQDLLKRPDRLLGTILIGNTFANIVASAAATLLAEHYLGDWGIVLATIVLTLVILIFAEVTPKTLAALKPEAFAYAIVWPLAFFAKLLSPLVWLVNSCARWILKPFGIQLSFNQSEALSHEEIKTVVTESASSLAQRHTHMLLGVLDLEQATIADVLVPRHRIIGLDLGLPIDQVIKNLKNCRYSRLPVYENDPEKLIGVLSLRDAIYLVEQSELCTDTIKALLEPIYYIPETARLQQQLVQFQQKATQLAIVVDEYGDIQGLVTVDDILEEIVGQLDSQTPSPLKNLVKLPDGEMVVDGSMTLRDLNRHLDLNLPATEAKTLGGLISEHLDAIPVEGTCLMINDYPIEVLKVEDNALKRAKISPRIKKIASA